MKTVAKRDGDDWLISGAKMWITNAPIADVAVIWAMTDEGIRGFIVPTDLPGFDIQEIDNKFSLRASLTGALFLDNVRVPASAMLPNAKGLRGPLGCLTKARFGITWGCIGAAQACLESMIDYTGERELFGRPLSHTQGIQLRLAEMARQITMAQLLSLRLGRLNDAGQMRPEQVSIAKWNNARMAIDIARDARDMLGGSGISAEYPPIRHMLNLESVITYEGTETVHQLVVGKTLTGVNAF
jgi:glutaryl-CoA dehydrogenase